MTMLHASPEPAPARMPRHDGLTPERQEEFLETLAATGSISEAAAAIGISRTALYKLRANPAASDFRARWAEALREATAVLAGEAFERALKGTSQPVWYKGNQIGERVRHDNRLLMFLLRAHDPETYGAVPARADSERNQLPGEGRGPVSGRSQLGPGLRRGTPIADPQSSRVLVSTSSTSQAVDDEDMDDETFRAELRKLRGSPPLPRHLSKRNARRLAAKGRLPSAYPG